MVSDLSQGSISPPAQEKATRHSRSITRQILVGAFLSLAWGASLRAWMVLLALEIGTMPQFTWLSTFGGVLLPATLMGALLGAATHVAAENSDRKR